MSITSPHTTTKAKGTRTRMANKVDMQGTDGTEVAHGQDETRSDMHVRVAAVVQKMTKKARRNVDKISSTFSSLKNAVLLRV